MYDYKRFRSWCGEDVRIDDHVQITRPQLVDIGDHIAIDFGFYCSTQLKIGDYVHISPHVSVVGGEAGLLEIDCFITISSGSRLVCGGETFSGEGLVGPFIPPQYRDKLKVAPIRLRRFSGIASNVVVFAGCDIAEGSVVGAGSVLTGSTEPWTIYAGVPARPIKTRRSDAMKAYAKKMGYA
jgi:acetyltransferase-like isoleucine patch superfamily enzyme